MSPARASPRLGALALAIAGAAATAALAVALAREGGLRATLAAALSQQGTWICVALAGAAAGGAPSLAARLGLVAGRLRLRDALVVAAGFVALSQSLHELLVALDLRGRGSLGAIDALVAHASGPDLALALVAIGLAPGFAEELLFRGWIQRGLAARLGSVAGVVAASALFGLVHADLVHGPAALMLGLYLGLVAERSGALGACVLAHATNNVLAVLAAGGRLPRPGGGVAAAALLALAAAAALVHLHRVTRAPAREADADAAGAPGEGAEARRGDAGPAP